MRASDIKIGETYLFLSTDSPARKHLEGQLFTVTEIKPVWRRLDRGRKKVQRFFNSDGVGARAEELQEAPEFSKLTDEEKGYSRMGWPDDGLPF